MKTNKTIISTILLFICLAFACVKSTPTANCGQLPCPTTTGANVVSCLVNGKPYIANGGKPDLSGMFGTCKQGSYVSSSALGGPNCKFTFRFCIDNYAQQLDISLGDSLKVGKFELGINNHVKFDGAYYNIVTNNLNKGVFNITNLTINSISGNFNFYASSDTNVNQYHITQGNFDIAR
jgi:hypothetical protein